MEIAGNNLKGRGIKSINLDKKTLERIFRILTEENKKSQIKEIENFKNTKKSDHISDDDLKKEVEQSLKTIISIWGKDGEFESVYNVEGLESFNWPIKIKAIVIENYSNFELIYKFRPANAFFIKFDFSYIDILDLISSPTLKTPNDSRFDVLGVDKGWVHGVEGQINDILISHEKPFYNLIHKENLYDFVLWFIFVPCFLLSISNFAREYPIIQNNFIAPLQPVCFIALIIVSFYLFRISFNIIRRVFPFASLSGDLKEPKDIWSLVRGVSYFLVTTPLAVIFSKLFD